VVRSVTDALHGYYFISEGELRGVVAESHRVFRLHGGRDDVCSCVVNAGASRNDRTTLKLATIAKLGEKYLRWLLGFVGVCLSGRESGSKVGWRLEGDSAARN